MIKNKYPNYFLNIIVIVFTFIAFAFFARGQLALLFFGNNPIEMSFRRAIVIDPENAAFPFALGVLREKDAATIQNVNRKLQRYREALGSMKRAIDLNPYQLAYRVAYSDLTLKVGLYEEGEKVFDSSRLAFDFEFLLARVFYYFKWASQIPDSEMQSRLIDKGVSHYRRAHQIRSEFIESILTKKLALLPEPTQQAIRVRLKNS